jgi:TP901 family phage tail tape measure protein
MQSMIRSMGQMESDMVVIARTTQDVTFNLDHMQDALIEVGKQYGHTWDTVSNIAIEWTRAGYNVADSLELVRTSLLALNVAEMDVKQATTGLIAIMSQWELQASDLETVIDKLNITSDRFPITTGDLIDALLRSSGAARAANIEFDELVGMITATRTASGRAGREIGNAMNTILSYITRQSTLNKLMAAGIEVFEDAATEKLRPALEMIGDVVAQWQDDAAALPQAFVDIADEMDLFNEELAEAVGMYEEWTDLQKVDIEQSMAGVRRRQFLIALLRNFSEVQEVVNNLQDAEGYSMLQNIRTMGTLEKQYQQLQMEATRLAKAIGDAGLLGQLKATVGVATDLVGVFATLDSRLQTFILTLGQVTLAVAIIRSLITMLGGGALLAATGPWGAIAVAAAALGGAYVLHTRKMTEEQERYGEIMAQVVDRQETLRQAMERSVKGSVEYEAALSELRDINREISDQYPHLIESYDTENRLIILNTEEMKKSVEVRERMLELQKQQEQSSVEIVNNIQDELEKIRESREQYAQQAQDYDDTARRLENLRNTRERLIREITQEGEESETTARKKDELQLVDEAIIRLSRRVADTMKDTSDITVDAINSVISVYRDLSAASTENRNRMIQDEIDKTERSIKLIKQRIEARRTEIMMLRGAAPAREVEMRGAYSDSIGGLSPYEIQLHSPHLPPTIEQQLQKSLGGYQSDVAVLDRVLLDLDGRLKDLDGQLADVAGVGGGGGGGSPAPGDFGATGAAKAVRSLNDILNEFIATTLRAAEVQGMLNESFNRERSHLERRISYYTRDGAAMWERVQAWRDEAEVAGLARKEQQGVEEQARLLRDAKSKLIERQVTLNLSTEEGREAYYRLEDQIESLKGEINGLSIEWFNLQDAQQIGITDLERITKLREANIDILSTELDYLTRAGASQEELARAEGIRALKIEQLVGLEEEYKREIEEQLQIRERSNRELERGDKTQEQHNQTLANTGSELARLQGLLRGNATEMENLSRATEKFNARMSDLQFQTRLGILSLQEMVAATRQAYGELGTLSIEDERRKILELTDLYRDKFNEMKRIAEEAYRDQLRALDRRVEAEVAIIQRKIDALDEAAKDRSREEDYRRHQDTMRDLTEKRLYHEQRTGIEHQKAIFDIDRDMVDEQRRWESQQEQWRIQDKRAAYQQQIQDIRDAAEAQRRQMEEAYQKMQADFSDHNINLLAVASAYDAGFFNDAQRKGQLWIQGFQNGIFSGFDGLMSLMSTAGDIVARSLMGATGTTSGGTIRHVSQFSMTDGRIDATLGQDVFAGDIIRTAGGDYQVVADSSDPRGFVGKKVPTAHTGAMTAGGGLAELIPGEMIFPPDLSAQLQKLLKVVASSPKAGMEVEGGRTISVNRLLHAENVYVDDKPDMVLLSRELRRQLSSIG